MATVIVEHQGRSQQNNAPAEWVAGNAPAVNVQATITKAAPGSGAMHVVKTIVACLTSDGTAPTAAAATLNLIFGFTGQSPALTFALAIEAVAGDRDRIVITDLNIEVLENTPVTLEFSAASGAHTLQTVTMTGYTKNRTPS